MNCSQCRHQLLTCDDLKFLAAEVEAHLAECPSCRTCRVRLQQIESNVSRLPVPFSERRKQFQQELLEGPLPAPAAEPLVRSRRRLWLAGAWGLAAAGVLIACGLFLGKVLSPKPDNTDLARNQKTKQPGPEENKNPLGKTLAARLLDLDLHLAQAGNPRQRVETLARLAKNLDVESRSLAHVAGPKDLHQLATLYGKVIGEGLVPRARKLPAAERREALPAIVEQLARAQREAEKLARKTSAETAAPLLIIAAASRKGDQQLRALMEETP